MMEASNEWYVVSNVESVDSPALLVYADRVKHNIRAVIESIDDISRLRPHIKTHKSPQICKLMMEAGIKKFKCATIAEAEMLASSGADDILLAYQPVGPKVRRLAELTEEYPKAVFSCLIDNLESASALSTEFFKINRTLPVYLDLNVGMNRTGITPDHAMELFESAKGLRGISITGLHVYDGHLRDSDYAARKKKCDEAFSPVAALQRKMQASSGKKIVIVAGGTPTFSIHCKRPEIDCSPGTFVYWDKGYEQGLPEQNYVFAALVLSRVISKPADKTICLDLGHKAIASENPLGQRVFFLNAPDLEPIGHSEEHMVFRCENDYKVGDVLYGVPQHICPTVALHDQAAVVEGHVVTDYWYNVSRNRKITI
jgi:D-threonine aldolase